MCGIYGIVGPGKRDDPELLDAMGARLRHRGPDGEGRRHTRLGTLGFRRLAVLDLPGGAQPMQSECGRIWATLNGEIYNFRELREELERGGVGFRTRSDAEVVVNGFARHGEAFISRLRGMFAIVLHDESRDCAYLIRDHIGKKPLYYLRHGGRLFYASEIKALLTIPSVSRAISHDALYHYLTFKNVPAPLSIYETIRIVEPGTYIALRGDTADTKRYWQPSFAGTSTLSMGEAEEQLRLLLAAAVRSRIETSDVPVAAFLSGGVDSSFVVALMAEQMPNAVRTFSLGYEEELSSKSDLRFARDIARMYGTRHEELRLSVADVIDELPKVVSTMDEPFSGAVSSYWLAKIISRHAKVALAGDGADELFGSYAHHRAAAVIAHARDSGHAHVESDAEWRTRFGSFTDQEKLTLLTPDFPRTANSSLMLNRLYADAPAHDFVNAVLEVDCRTLLPDHVLTYADRLSMASSLEVRSPFLDLDIIEFAGSLPGHMKVTLTETKRVLKNAARSVLPSSIVDRPKEGFILPIDRWLSGPLRGLRNELFSSECLGHGLFRLKAIQSLLAEHDEHRANNSYKIWNLMMFQLWYQGR